jgi:hypothetical protein
LPIARTHEFVSFSKSISQDYNKPLLIPAGSDSMQQIGGLGATSTGTISKGPGAAIDRWKHTFTTYFPQVIKVYKYSALISRH